MRRKPKRGNASRADSSAVSDPEGGRSSVAVVRISLGTSKIKWASTGTCFEPSMGSTSEMESPAKTGFNFQGNGKKEGGAKRKKRASGIGISFMIKDLE
ncbi:MAG TPA: hypothetical protein GX507_06340 [Clostridia bacterium]|nr:hypothetical protein [Clostridia bacterium]